MHKILIVEDDQFLSKLYKIKLQKEGFEVELAFDGQEGLEKFKSFKPELVLLDLIMPKIDGFTFLAKMKEDPDLYSDKVPIIVFSNLGQDSDFQKAKELGAQDFFIKADIGLDKIVAKVREY